jgi:uncharacterized membrane protein YkvI
VYISEKDLEKELLVAAAVSMALLAIVSVAMAVRAVFDEGFGIGFWTGVVLAVGLSLAAYFVGRKAGNV